MGTSQSKGLRQKMRERKLISGVNRQGTLEEKGVKQGLWAPQCESAWRTYVYCN